MITKEKAQVILDAGPNQLVRFADHMDAMRTVIALHKRVERLTEALEFYADPDFTGFDVAVTDYGLSTEVGAIVKDAGETARAILKETTHD